MKRNTDVPKHADKSLWKMKMYTATVFDWSARQITLENYFKKHTLVKRNMNLWMISQCQYSSRRKKKIVNEELLTKWLVRYRWKCVETYLIWQQIIQI